MSISANLEYLEDLMEQLYRMQQQVNIIAESFRRLEAGLDIEIKRDLSICEQIGETSHRLFSISDDCKNYAHFVEIAVAEYRELENKILELSQQIASVNSPSLGINKVDIRVGKEQLREDSLLSDHIILREEIGFCSLPQMKSFIKSYVNPGIIEGGRNILIRSWTKTQGK